MTNTFNFTGKIPEQYRSTIEAIKAKLAEENSPNSNGDVLESLLKLAQDQPTQEIEEIGFDDIDESEVEDVPVSYGAITLEYNNIVKEMEAMGIKTLSMAKSIEKSTLGGLFVIKSGDTIYSINASCNFKEDLTFLSKALAKGRVNAKLSLEQLKEKYGPRYNIYNEFREISMLEDMKVEIVSLNPVNTIVGMKEYLKYIKDGAKASVKWPI